MKKAKLAVLASGNGSNLQAILESCQKEEIPAEVCVVLSNRGKAFALERARSFGVDTVVLKSKSFETREGFDLAMASEIEKREVDLIVLAGYMRILSRDFVGRFQDRLINLHPSLLPKYPGLESIERALEAGEKETGVTIHFVDEGVDTGPIILQEHLKIEKGESLESLTQRIHELEHRTLPRAISMILKKSGKKV